MKVLLWFLAVIVLILIVFFFFALTWFIPFDEVVEGPKHAERWFFSIIEAFLIIIEVILLKNLVSKKSTSQ